jgi:hypothetical protein
MLCAFRRVRGACFYTGFITGKGEFYHPFFLFLSNEVYVSTIRREKEWVKVELPE